jgi:hypothetical protein
MNTFEITHSDQMNELFGALSKTQANILVAAKDSINPFFKSRFSDLPSVWSAIRKPLTDNGLCIIQSCEGDKNEMFLVTWLGHSSGQWMKSKLLINPAKSDPQSLGSFLTYMRRYSLSAMVGVVSDEDDDCEAAMKAARKVEVPKIDEKKILRDFLIKVLPEDDANEEQWVLKYLEAHAKLNKHSVAISCQKYSDLDKFREHMNAWKEKQIKIEEDE